MATDNKNGTVLVTNTSELVDIVVNEKDDFKFLITVDSENLLRAWNIKTSTTAYSYKIPMKKRVTAITVDQTFNFLAVGNLVGEVLVLNLKSGGILYSLPHTESEVTCLQFLSGMSEFWLVAGCWSGKVMMWTNPNEENNFTITAKCRIGHKDDVLAIDSSNSFIVSAGVDGLVSVWNLFSGILKFAIALPQPTSGAPETEDELNDRVDLREDLSEGDLHVLASPVAGKKRLDNSPTKASPMKSPVEESYASILNRNEADPEVKASNKIKKSIVDLCFHPYYPNFVCVLQEGGDVHIVDVSNGSVVHEYVAKVKINSNWACDKES
mmetsp:Transcript_33488/g.32549  ORF Transcript_33488/g.32549 Transcript_33488/m.32549 type:complete len:325 (+) Transcript_33488:1540-2514(+)